MKKTLLTLALVVSSAAQATQMDISIELPQQEFQGRFYPPFVTAWVEKDRKMIGTLLMWYHKDKNADSVNVEWVKGLKKWWRRGGKSVDLVAFDTIAGATKKPGTHTESFTADNQVLSQLEKGVEYKLVIEANREKGSNESIDLAFTLGDSAQAFTLQGSKEIGEVVINVKP